MIAGDSRLPLRGGRRWVAAVAVALVACVGCASIQRTPVPSETARRSAPGATMTVEGFVTDPPGLFASFTGDQGFAVEDATGGIYIALSGAFTASLGQGVFVTGRLTDIAGLITLASSAELIGPTSQERVVQPMRVKTGAVGPATEGRLVEIRGTITRPLADDRPYGFKIAVDDGSGETQVFIPVSTGIDPHVDPVLRAGQGVTVVGFSGRYEETQEVVPRFRRDLSVPAP